MDQQGIEGRARSVAANITRRGAAKVGLLAGLGLLAPLRGTPGEGQAKRANRRDHRQRQRQNKRQNLSLQASRNDVDEICGVRPFCLLPLDTGFMPVGAIPSGTVEMCFSWRYFNCQTCDGTDLAVIDAECNTTYVDACGGACTTDPSVRTTSPSVA